MNLPISPLQFVEEDENGNRFWMKREDMLPFSFGGNKLRIGLAYLEDFHREGADRLIAYGNARSNLCRVLANLCAAEGIPLTIIRPADDDGVRRESFNSRLIAQFGAEIVPCTKQNVAQTVDGVFAACREHGEKPYYIYGNRLGQGREEVPPAAIVPLWAELLQQEAEAGLHFDAVALAAGTGMTLAGLAAGAFLAQDERPILGLSVARDQEGLAGSTRRYLSAWQEKNGCAGTIPLPLCCDRHRESYGHASPAVHEEIRRMMRSHGIPLDATYTGKAWYALQQEAKQWKEKNILFLHTGGTPLFFDEWEEMA